MLSPSDNGTSKGTVWTSVRKKNKADDADDKAEKRSRHVQCKQAARESKQKLDANVAELFQSGRLLAAISPRPGQGGHADGYVLEGEELAFYKRKLEKKKRN